MEDIRDKIIIFIENIEDLTYLTEVIVKCERQKKRIQENKDIKVFDIDKIGNDEASIKEGVIYYIESCYSSEWLSILMKVSINRRERIVYDNSEEDDEDRKHYENNKKKWRMNY